MKYSRQWVRVYLWDTFN